MSDGSRPHLANAADIERWAEEVVEARTQFPRLIRRLISQTNDQVTSLDMRADIGAGIEGYDGIVEASRATPFVPLGRSVWELGTSGDPAEKASEDYLKRVNKSLGEDRANTTFVFVTSRRWPKKHEWANRRKKRKDWLDVKAYDADDIEIALEAAPAVHFWLSELLNKPVSGIITLEQWWDRFVSYTAPALSPEVILAGRLDQASTLLGLLEQDSQITTIASTSTDDVLAFVAAVLQTSPPETRANLLPRALIVKDALSLRRLEATAGLLILLPYEDDLRREAQTLLTHHVIFLAYSDGVADIDLPPIDSEVFAGELERLGVARDKAREYAAAARQSLVSFQRAAAPRSVPVSAWQLQLQSKVVRRAWLCGGWSERRSGDQDALSAAAGRRYEDSVDELRAAADGPDPLFTVVGGTWAVSSLRDSWADCRRRLTLDDLRAHEEVVQTVLGAVDPALDLPVEERWSAAIHGKARIHSTDLRRGLASTLAFMAASGHDAKLRDGLTAANWAQSVAARLLQRAREDLSARLWASLADVLALLGEAAPDAFLEAVEAGLKGTKPPLANLFVDKGNALSVSSPHTYLLWALEGIAWSEDHASFAISLLARLAEVDPGGRLSNRPASSLSNILKPWLPQTSLSAVRRLKVLDYLIERHNVVAWRLMIDLLPDGHAVGFPVHSPKFRDWKPSNGDAVDVSMAEYWSFVDEVVTRLLENLGGRSERWAELIGAYQHLSQEQRGRIRGCLVKAVTETKLSADSSAIVWEAVDELVRRHRTYAEAEWALPEDDLAGLEEAASPFKPPDPAKGWHWLFNSHVPDLGAKRTAGGSDYLKALQKERTRAATEILQAEGLQGAIQLAEECELPGALGFAVADSGEGIDDDAVVSLLDSQKPRLVNFAQGFVSRRLAPEPDNG